MPANIPADYLPAQSTMGSNHGYVKNPKMSLNDIVKSRLAEEKLQNIKHFFDHKIDSRNNRMSITNN